MSMLIDTVPSTTTRRRALGLLLLALLVLAAGLSVALRPGTRTSANPSPAVAGIVVVLGGCPVMRAGRACPAHPVADAQVSLWRDGGVVATGRTDEHGRFRLAAAAGQAEVRAQTSFGGYVARASSTVTLSSGSSAEVRLVLDNGVR